MKKLVTSALVALTLGGALAATTVSADAQPFRGGYYHGGYRGPGVGAAVAGHPYYAYPPAYYAPEYPTYPAYGYAPAYGYGPYWHHYYGYAHRHW
jgi:hypothetical protein